jgi:hypothetical protein
MEPEFNRATVTRAPRCDKNPRANRSQKIDGGEQFFSRANDFDTQNLRRPCKSGIKKSTIRCGVEFQPDVIINRFDHRTAGTTHGHHTASAILSTESFNLANDPTVFPIN